MLQKYLDLRRPVSVEVSMNTPSPQKIFFQANRDGLRLAGDTTNPYRFKADLEKYPDIKELAAMCHAQRWKRDCTQMLDLL
jgi:hypothetical protein